MGAPIAIPAEAVEIQPPVWQPEPPPLTDHFELMGEFLQNQDIITRFAVQTQHNGSAPLVSGWTGSMDLPFPAAVEFISGDAALGTLSTDDLTAYLGNGDLDYFEQAIQALGPRRQREWLIGRISARRAVSAWLGATGDERPGQEPQIDYDTEGRPVLAWPAGNGAVFLSISHKDGIAVAAAADRPVGIDLERFTAVRDPDGVLRVAFSAAEAAVLEDAGGCDVARVTIAWSAKEAAAKSLGQKMLGREQSFVVTAFDPERGSVRVTHDGSVIDAFFTVDGDYVCTLAAVAERAVH
jgi:4'-phosphopantetheinyl transferase EntD